MKFGSSKLVVLSLCSIFCSSFVFSARGADTASVRRSIFSTSTDWEAITGLRLSEFNIRFGRDKTMGAIGTELYFLDGFPCYARAENARAWVSPSIAYAIDKDAFMRVVCLAVPPVTQLAFREVSSNASHARSTGMLTCPTEKSDRDILINLALCERLDNWGDYK